MDGPVLEFNLQTRAELLRIERVPADAELLADRFRLLQGKSHGWAHRRRTHPYTGHPEAAMG